MKTILSLLCLIWGGLQLAEGQVVGTHYTNPSINFEGITWMPNGDIYTVDYYGGAVYRITPDGSISTIASGLGNIAGGGADGEGNFYFSVFSAGTVYKVTPDGQYSLFVSGLVSPAGLHLSPDSNYLYVAEFDSSRVSKIKLSDQSVTKIASGGGMLGVDGITVMPNGDILAASFYNTRITRIKPDGTTSLFGMHPSGGYMGYIARGGDYYYVASIGGNDIARFDSLGNVEIIAGSGIQGYQDGAADSARFSGPNGITANAAGDSVLITEAGQIRVLTDISLSTNLEEELPEARFEVFPSPFGERLYVRSAKQQSQELKLELLDQKGQLIAQWQKQNLTNDAHKLEVPSLAEGVYFLRIIEDGQLTHIRKLVHR
ncbi:MAG: SMP-30/gluconolactonase/LRE family protein [Bacteroidota bacterium]